MDKGNFPSAYELLAVRDAVAPYIHNTPVMTSSLIDKLADASLHFKCDNFQRMGAFKMRGATNAILKLPKKLKRRGVVTHSSGNFAQALALAAAQTGCSAYIVMPENAPSVKKRAVKDYGGTIIESESTPQAREAKAEEVRLETGAEFIHPSDNIDVIAGNSTLAQEFIEAVPDLDIIIAPVGGGGLIAGTALAAHYFGNKIRVIGAEPTGADDAFRSFRDGRIYPSENPQTICDGLRTNLGEWNFPIIRKYVSEIILVEDRHTIEAMRLIWERMKIIVEPSAAITLACVLQNKEKFRGQRVGLVMCGGNVDLADVCSYLVSQ